MQLFTFFCFGLACLISVKAQNSPAEGLSLDKKWETKMQGGSGTMTDLTRLFGDLIQPNVDLAPHPDIEIYRGVTYLMPIKEAVKTLGLTGSLPSRSLVVCPGFPRESFYYYSFKGLFDGYNQIYIVVDRADQVASIQLVAETPRAAGYLASYSEDDSWLTYNYVNYRVKAIRKLRIKNSVEYLAQSKKPSWQDWHPGHSPEYPFEILRINTVLSDPNFRSRNGSTEPRLLEAVRWYLPVPLAELLLHCIHNSTNSNSR